MGRIAVLEAEAKKKDLKIATLESRVAQLMAELRLALYRQFGKSSEQLVGQADLPFDDLKLDETSESVEAESEAAQAHRKKAGRKPLADIPRVDHFHDLTEAEKICACGHQRSKIGEDISEKLNMIPAQVWVDRHHYAKYACELCQGLSDESKPAVTRATGEPDLIPRSIITPGLLAHIWTAKFCDHLPFYRQAAGFARHQPAPHAYTDRKGGEALQNFRMPDLFSEYSGKRSVSRHVGSDDDIVIAVDLVHLCNFGC